MIHGVRNAGLIVGVHGKSEDLGILSKTSDVEGTPVDVILDDGKFVFTDRVMEELI